MSQFLHYRFLSTPHRLERPSVASTIAFPTVSQTEGMRWSLGESTAIAISKRKRSAERLCIFRRSSGYHAGEKYCFMVPIVVRKLLTFIPPKQRSKCRAGRRSEVNWCPGCPVPRSPIGGCHDVISYPPRLSLSQIPRVFHSSNLVSLRRCHTVLLSHANFF
ncbi:hypothetical protein J6590_089681 [Homalodisca vitripennis]|nr:hypothetical protein J6590_060486 [Homalodisca vitripennis]KAG8309296.1 hypothetical protein J6590_089681 [Homalodisca vitripennis]